VPTRPPRVCSGCGEAVTGRCPTCSPPRAWARKPSSWKGGSTRRWRNFRAGWLAEHPLCAGYPFPCGVVAEHVDHITPLSRFPPGPERERARFDHGNVQSLCVPCHRRKTNDESREQRAIYRAQEKTGQLW
jgi:5-methylcytosine-specific restriction endonuclease McrA